IADEDDIHTSTSHGTSPSGSPEFVGDDSTTENSTGAALVTGSLGHLVSIGADAIPNGSGIPTFAFTSDVIQHMLDLGRFSKQSLEPATDNGIPLIYRTSTDGNDIVLTAYEPDPNVDPGNGNPPNLGATGNIVFELRVDQSTGDYEFRLFDELMHT